MKDINSVFVESLNNIRSKVVSTSRKDKFSSKTSLR